MEEAVPVWWQFCHAFALMMPVCFICSFGFLWGMEVLGARYWKMLLWLGKQVAPHLVENRNTKLFVRALQSGDLVVKIETSTPSSDEVNCAVLNLGDHTKTTYTRSKSDPSMKSDSVVTPLG